MPWKTASPRQQGSRECQSLLASPGLEGSGPTGLRPAARGHGQLPLVWVAGPPRLNEGHLVARLASVSRWKAIQDASVCVLGPPPANQKEPQSTEPLYDLLNLLKAKSTVCVEMGFLYSGFEACKRERGQTSVQPQVQHLQGCLLRARSGLWEIPSLLPAFQSSSLKWRARAESPLCLVVRTDRLHL